MSNLNLITQTISKTDCVIIGAGVIGLACAKLVASRGLETLILEKNAHFGMETSSRNSEVIHAGIYYSNHSLKAKLCVKGKRLLYDYLTERSIPFKQCGKLIVATTEIALLELHTIREKALRNGVTDLCILDPISVRSLEPEIHCLAALYSPSTGIIDSHTYMLNLLADAENAGASLIPNCTVNSGMCSSQTLNNNHHHRITLITNQGVIQTKTLINAGGLYSIDIIKKIDGFPKNLIPTAYFAKGNYFKLNGSLKPFSRLIYPIPEMGGLGVHATIDLHNNVRFGPDVEWLHEDSNNEEKDAGNFESQSVNINQNTRINHSYVPNNYQVDPLRSVKFYDLIRRYYPNLPDNSLIPDYSGIRPKLSHPTKPTSTTTVMNSDDFMIQSVEEHGVQGLVNLLGIESPGLTASLAIARYVNTKLKV